MNARNPICPQMLTNSFCGDSDSDSADWCNKTISELPHHASSHMPLREGARPEVVRGILGHANIDVTQNQELGSTRGQSPKTNCATDYGPPSYTTTEMLALGPIIATLAIWSKRE